MEINLLALNIGNSRLALGVFEAGELRYIRRLGHEQRSDWPAMLSDAWKRIADTENPSIAAACVNSTIFEPLEHAVHAATSQKVQWIGRDIDLPIPVLTNEPAQTGVDRVLNVAAAYEQLGKACVVVDAGTAITVNFCNDRGEFVGGAIAPGISMMLEALHEKTAKLPRVTFETPTGSFGKNTTDAIRQGVFHSIRGMVKEMVENYATELGAWPELIVTGGDAVQLFEGWELVHAISPDLTLYGIALAYTEHHIKHGT
jgi:type III pantothenate kinase